jgi:mannose-6-phosphate isomerase-like protein (cupin superfamily)
MTKESMTMTSSEIKIVPKGWGYEKWIANSELYCGKLLFIRKGHRCSWHYHTNKDETFYIQSGEVLLIYGDVDDMEKAKMKVLGPGDKFYVYPGLRHQMQAREDTELFEFSTQHFDSDSNRIEPGD